MRKLALALWVAGLLQAAAWGQAGDGVLRLHPENGHYLLFRGKPTILIGSTEHYGAVMNLDFDYGTYLEELAEKKLNQTRTFSGTYYEVASSFGITDNTLAPKRYIGPWARSSEGGAAAGGNRFDLAKFDDAYFARLKDFVARAGEKGIVVEYVLFCPFYDEGLWTVNPMRAANNVNGVGSMPRTEVYTLKHKAMVAVHEAFVRKAVRELNEFDNVYFEICNEPYFGGVTLEWQRHISGVIAETERALPRKHLIAQNIANAGQKIEKPDDRVSIFNFHYATPPETVGENYGLNKVLGDDETGFRGKADVLYRTEAWEFIIAGGATYDNLDYSFTVAHPRGGFRDYKSPGGGSPELRKQLGFLRTFTEGFEFVKMKPMNEAIKGGSITANLAGDKNSARAPKARVRCLAEAGKAYALYVLGGRSAELAVELPKGRYTAEWVNPKTGAVDKRDAFEHGGGTRTLAAPAYEEDVALRIRAN